ncbi:MAG: acyl-CoA dehydrogenase [Dehalococcoidia bacterium]|nr:acyl-CoA dehydrogenase [Dehalococcoidia bacterium]
MSSPATATLLGDDRLYEALRDYCGPRAADVDACRTTLREGIEHLAGFGATDLGVYGRDSPEDFERMCEIVATVAFDDMSQAFSLWCHRMAIEYVQQSDEGCPAREAYVAPLRTGERLGSTSMAAATANFLAGTPLTLTFRRCEGGIVVNGRIAWASNLAPPFLSVAAAANEDDPSDRVVFAYTEATPGLQLPSYPELLALQATSSTSPVFADAVIGDEAILTWDFEPFIQRTLATFLLLQSSFCWGLAARSLSEVGQLEGPRAVLAPAYDDLRRRFDAAEGTLRSLATQPDRTETEHRSLLQLRLDFGRLAVESVALEAKLAGGRGYMLHSGTARRLREAAFLPVQAPTEVQLQWLLTRSA